MQVWSGETFEKLNFKWGDVHRVAESIVTNYPDGPKLDAHDPNFATLSSSINVALASKPLNSPHEIKGVHTVNGDTIVITYEDPETPQRKMKVCNNMIVNDIPGNITAVLNAGKLYVESMKNFSVKELDPFKGAWKWELFRVMGPMVTECSHLKVLRSRDDKVFFRILLT